jgi:hypothetical protein
MKSMRWPLLSVLAVTGCAAQSDDSFSPPVVVADGHGIDWRCLEMTGDLDFGQRLASDPPITLTYELVNACRASGIHIEHIGMETGHEMWVPCEWQGGLGPGQSPPVVRRCLGWTPGDWAPGVVQDRLIVTSDEAAGPISLPVRIEIME